MKSTSPIIRRKSRQIMVGDVAVGGDAPISVQSMTNTDTCDVEATVGQIEALQKVGADIVRVSVPTMDAAEAFGQIKQRVSIPLVTDIHFDYKIALRVAELGADCLRINPGNIGKEERVRAVIDSARDHNIPIRIGVNAGSLEKELQVKYGEPSADALVESALRHIDILDRLDFQEYKISLKASEIFMTVAAYRKLATQIEQPLHLGITEAGGVGQKFVPQKARCASTQKIRAIKKYATRTQGRMALRLTCNVKPASVACCFKRSLKALRYA